MKNAKRIEVSKKIDNYVAYMIEYAMTAYMPSREHLKRHLSKETIQKYDEFMDSLCNDVGHLSCYEFTDDYIIECGYDYADSNAHW